MKYMYIYTHKKTLAIYNIFKSTKNYLHTDKASEKKRNISAFK